MSLKKKLLLVGGGYADIPLIQAAKSLGFYVITSGNRSKDLGHQHSDEVRLADFSDPQAVLAVAQELKIDAICACCNDFSALSASYVAEKMGLPGHDSYETAQVIHHKDLYRNFAQKNGIPSPRAEGFSAVDDAMREVNKFHLPLIIKPVDLTGGKGISTANNIAEIKPAIVAAFEISRAKRVVLEEFITGSRHGLSTFIRDGRVVFAFCDNEYYYQNPYMVSAASTPAGVPIKAIERLKNQAEKIASLLSLKTGIFHIQFILHEDEPVIIEICRRAPGDLYIRFVEHATNVSYPLYIVRAAAGMDCDNLEQVPIAGYFTRHCIMSARTGVIKRVVIDPSVQSNIIDQMLWWKQGDVITDMLTQKQGIVFLKFSSMDEMLEKTGMMHDLIRVDVE